MIIDICVLLTYGVTIMLGMLYVTDGNLSDMGLFLAGFGSAVFGWAVTIGLALTREDR